MMLLAILAVLIFAYSLASRRLDETAITGPMAFTVAGIAVGSVAPAEVAAGINSKLVLHLAETGLVLLLFTDAGRTDLSLLWNIRGLPARLLGIGLPLTIVAGAAAARLIFPGFPLWEGAILAAVLAPTDAGLGQVIVNDPRAPAKIRQALNVEAGLNDGLAVPFLLFFMALAAADQEGAHASLVQYIVEQLGYGVAVGAGIGLAGGFLLGWAARRGWMSDALKQAGVVALPVLCIVASDALAASMFIAAFVAGMAVQAGFRDVGMHSLEFGEIWGQVINLSVFFLFGLVIARDWRNFSLEAVAYAILSLTVVRLVPVAIAMIGQRLGWPTILFVGWFGPRGLASIVLGLVYLEQEIHLGNEPIFRMAATLTILLSIFAHGLSARPGVALYARAIAGREQAAKENAKRP